MTNVCRDSSGQRFDRTGAIGPVTTQLKLPLASSERIRPIARSSATCMIVHVLPETGRVLGIDVGYSLTKRTTAFCHLTWTKDRIDWTVSSATAELLCRKQALRAVQSQNKQPFLSVAIDGPLRPRLRVRYTYRTAECVLSRGAFQKRGKPGQTNAGSGPPLHKNATSLAKMVRQYCSIGSAQMPFSASNDAVYEAFPNLFLGVLCDEREYPVRPSKGRCWTDCLFPIVASRLEKLIQTLLPERRFEGVQRTAGHEPIAALTCAITALSAAAGQCVAVGARTDGYIVLPPLSLWGLSVDQAEPWAERELRDIQQRLAFDKRSVQASQIYCGAKLWDVRKNRPATPSAPQPTD